MSAYFNEIAFAFNWASTISSQGSSRAVNMMEWDKIWAYNKKVGLLLFQNTEAVRI